MSNKTFKVVMLPTKKASVLTLSPLKTKFRFKDEYKLSQDVYQHLYIISDEDIKEGDWCIKETPTFAEKFVVQAKGYSDIYSTTANKIKKEAKKQKRSIHYIVIETLEKAFKWPPYV